eukprot:494735_1
MSEPSIFNRDFQRTDQYYYETDNCEDIEKYISSNSLSLHSLAILPFEIPVSNIIESHYIGNQLGVRIPRKAKDRNDLSNMIVKLIKTYKQKYNIKHVTLTGMVAATTHYGQDVIDRINEMNDYELYNVKITNAYPSTVACMVLNTIDIVKKVNRNFSNEIIGVYGCGIIGYNTLLLLMSSLKTRNNYPQKILLCDSNKKQKTLSKLQNDLIKLYNFDNVNILIKTNDNDLNKFNNECTLILGATYGKNNPKFLLDPYKLQKGCIVVDDSLPHCFDELKFYERFKQKNDIFYVEAGLVELPYGVNRMYVWNTNDYSIMNTSKYPKHLTARCMLGGALLHRFPDRVKPKIGALNYNDGVKILQLLKDISIKPAQYQTPHFYTDQNDKLLSLNKFIIATNVNKPRGMAKL